MQAGINTCSWGKWTLLQFKQWPLFRASLLTWQTRSSTLTWAIEAEPRGSISNLSNTSSIPCPSSLSSISFTVWNGVAGEWSHSVTSLLTHAAGAKSGLPIIWATCFSIYVHIKDTGWAQQLWKEYTIMSKRNGRGRGKKKQTNKQNASHKSPPKIQSLSIIF